MGIWSSQVITQLQCIQEELNAFVSDAVKQSLLTCTHHTVYLQDNSLSCAQLYQY